MAATSSAQCRWEGTLVQGHGTVSVGSGAFGPLPVTWAGRTERTKGATSPEEFIAAALASCFCMAMAHGLSGQQLPPTWLDATADVTFDNGKITTATVKVTGAVPGASQSAFQQAAEAGCPVSRALSGVAFKVESATLQS
jgi:osmotically inducible protein OsmC